MSLKIALAGNPNSGKTTLFNALTGSNQFVGNWPGVTVEKKEGKLKKHDGVTIVDLPGIYSLSPYTLEEVVARNYLISERPDAILNIVDGTNLERNLYLTTQLTELGIPVVIAINMMDVVKKNGDKINIAELSRELGCSIVEISALKGTGVMEAAEAAVEAGRTTKTVPMHTFSGVVEHALAHIEEAAVHTMPPEQQRWYAIKIFERDEKVLDQMNLNPELMEHIEGDIQAAEKELDDDAESIITNERYVYIASVMKGCYRKKSAGRLSTSDKIDRVVTNRFAGGRRRHRRRRASAHLPADYAAQRPSSAYHRPALFRGLVLERLPVRGHVLGGQSDAAAAPVQSENGTQQRRRAAAGSLPAFGAASGRLPAGDPAAPDSLYHFPALFHGKHRTHRPCRMTVERELPV